MKIELLYVAGCPNHQPALNIVEDVLREQGLTPDVTQIEVSSPAQAAAVAFFGSPTVRVDGKDVDPTVNLFPSYGVSCRAYFVDGRLEGVPPREWILNAVLSSKSSQRTRNLSSTDHLSVARLRTLSVEAAVTNPQESEHLRRCYE